jgi:hypothetical protein
VVGATSNAGLFADYLDAVAGQRDRAFAKLNADACGPNRSEAVKSTSATPPNSAGTGGWLGHMASEPLFDFG